MSDESNIAFEKWHLAEYGFAPPPALDCKQHIGMDYGNMIVNARWQGFNAACTITEAELELVQNRVENIDIFIANMLIAFGINEYNAIACADIIENSFRSNGYKIVNI